MIVAETGARSLGVAVPLALLGMSIADAQTGGLQPTRRLPDIVPRLETPETPDLAPAAPSPPLPAEAGGVRFRLSGVRFEGNTVFSDEILTAAVADLVGREVGIEALEGARRRLTRLYVDAGYVSSGVVVPTQDIADGIVLFRAVEGRLGRVLVEGEGVGERSRPFGDIDPDYVRRRLQGHEGEILRIQALEERFRILLQDPQIERLDGDLVPGREPGEAVLDVEVERAPAISARLGFDNFDPPSTGVYAGEAAVTLRNATGFADTLDLEADISQGRQSVFGRLALPLSPRGLTAFAEIEAAQTEIVEAPLDELDIESEFLRGGVGLDADLWRTSTDTLSFEAFAEIENSRIFLLGEPFSFSAGVEDGRARAAVLRLSQQYVRRAEAFAVSTRAELSFGVDVFDATVNADAPDGRFASFLGQFFAVRRLPGEATISLRGIGQYAFDRLLPFEQIELGGADSVRGFRENAVVVDSVAYATLALTVPLADLAPPSVAPPEHTGTVSVRPFVAGGTGWLHGDFDERVSLVGAGASLLWSPRPKVDLEVGFAGPVFAGPDETVEALEDLRAYLSIGVRF